jgi:amino acid transporter
MDPHGKDSSGEKVATDSPIHGSHDLETAERGVAAAPAGPPNLHRKLKGRHMQMIAIGGSIGAGLFVGSGKALHDGGPASLVIDFIIIGIMLLFTVNALGELAAMLVNPTSLNCYQ